jgi:UDP-N-acetylglucosamine acyltransferase
MIHPTAIIDPSASIADDVKIGAFTVIGADVSIGEGCDIGPHVVIQGPSYIGKNNKFFQFSSIGECPQDKKYNAEPTPLYIGDGNTIREFVTINRGTTQDIGETRLGNDNWIMAYVHIAHDCVLGNNIVMANNASLAGHVHIGDNVILGGFTLIYQFCKVGKNAFSAFASHINKDVPPYVMVAGTPAIARGLNNEGLKRHNFSSEDTADIKKAYRILYRSGDPLSVAKEKCQQILGDNEHVKLMLSALENTHHGVISGKE